MRFSCPHQLEIMHILQLKTELLHLKVVNLSLGCFKLHYVLLFYREGCSFPMTISFGVVTLIIE